ncbi:type II secretion system F family protein [Sphingobium agri]|uniref:Type II secretion system F family protein n=1 Tax=Sphingobium agri TaxID=2933566 RepID=A0ABT0DSA0_9SPHN|nr:type II secretion system F family protein [Sphingobium agri]MCK0529993.1 type II secretion system F family protein [Sphingobium agri]
MPSPFLLACFLMALLGLGIAVLGGRMLMADRRLEARLSRLAPSTSAQAKTAIRLPTILGAEGRNRSSLERQLQLAGYQDPRAVNRFLWLRLAGTILAALLAALLCRIAWGEFLSRPMLIVIAAGLAFVGARQMLNLLASGRARKITAEFPFLLDLMLMMLESGVSLDQCFRSIARDEQVAVPHHGELIGLLVSDLDRGMRYELALDRWAARVAVSGAKELASLFRQAMFQGIELAPALREFAREFTQRRVARAREAMGGITVRMVVLMILFFMPALFIVLGGPPVVAILDTLRASAR